MPEVVVSGDELATAITTGLAVLGKMPLDVALCRVGWDIYFCDPEQLREWVESAKPEEACPCRVRITAHVEQVHGIEELVGE